MEDLLVTDVLAQAFKAEGVDTIFTLMGDANMYWAAKMADEYGVNVVHARHEHCACAMADGYARATGRVGVASTTCGPGYTQIMTALTIAARGNVPMVVFAGDAPIGAAWYLQQIDMGPLALACGAHYVPVRSLDRMLDNVREAFQVAQTERKPVVLGVPMDLQAQTYPYMADYTPSADIIPIAQRPAPDPVVVDKLIDMIETAERPILLAGRGATWSGARDALAELAAASGALLATSLYGKGLFDDDAYGLGIAGAFASDFARERFAEADLVIGVGAGLGHYTTEGGYLYPMAQTAQIDVNPRGLWQGLRTADLHIRADAKAAAEALLKRMRERGVAKTGQRTADMAAQIAADHPDAKEFPVQANTVDPRKIVLELDQTIPKDWDIVVGGGHYFSMVMTHMRGRPAERYHVVNDFGAIGSGLPAAIGIAAARGDGKVALIEGDGSLLMHVQELETIQRHGIKLLINVINDGGYGAEFHKFRARGIEAGQAIHGRADLAGMAKGFGLGAATVTGMGATAGLFQDHGRSNIATVWDVHSDDKIPSRAYRRVHYGEA